MYEECVDASELERSSTYMKLVVKNVGSFKIVDCALYATVVLTVRELVWIYLLSP